jgi:pimeloyl-ACP methyl ester carboxylesterase
VTEGKTLARHKEATMHVGKRFLCLAALVPVFAVAGQGAQRPLDDARFGQIFRSESARVEQMNIHYVAGGSGDVVVLLHGWPQTWFEWRDLMPDLAQRYRVIALDLPGLGQSDGVPPYDKKALAQHIHKLFGDLKIPAVHLVGHDMGGIVAYAYARQFPAAVKSLVIVDTPIPGLNGWRELQSQSPRWHWLLHNVPELPEALISGKEKVYLSWFFQSLAFNKTVFSDARINRYVQAYSKPSSLHAGFEYYRAFEKDAMDNADYGRHKLTVPVLALGGENSRLNKYVVDQLRPAATNLTGDLVPKSGHWIPEEQPEWLAQRLITFWSGL